VLKYESATDPRLAVVKKLIGVKRKTSFGSPRSLRAPPFWEREHEDWISPDALPPEDVVPSDDEDEEPEVPEEESPLVSRPATPQPDYLPLGPTLLHTQFHPSFISSLGTPLRPPAGAPPVSVPTPVSPGAATEKEKSSLEAAAGILAKEFVQNSVWAEAWRSNVATGVSSVGVWAADVRTLQRTLGSCAGSAKPLSLSSLFHLGKLVHFCWMYWI
jgi:mediator of RNA polymerase II transcription subunit 13